MDCSVVHHRLHLPKRPSDKCPPPLAVELAEFFAESYKVGTEVKYECEKGYKRKSGQARFIKCSSEQDGFGRWTTVECIVDPNLPLPPLTQPTTQTEEGNEKADGLPTTGQPLMKGFCGVLNPPKQVKAVSTTYTVGQELQYRCRDGYQARSPIFGRSTCQNVNKQIVWSKLRLRCTNDTTSFGEDIRSEMGTPHVPIHEVVTATETGTGGHPRLTSSAALIYTASVVFAISVMPAL
ncbi:interleukin-2 receptor subunit alpha-like isoform X2 [Paroedura picta]|uniref:interleukin-2 receptor subunit alpha-like isoform X2 n=1 Tax=Paroedura picta TaxID=143630 RepID=UPI004056CAEA